MPAERDRPRARQVWSVSHERAGDGQEHEHACHCCQMFTPQPRTCRGCQFRPSLSTNWPRVNMSDTRGGQTLGRVENSADSAKQPRRENMVRVAPCCMTYWDVLSHRFKNPQITGRIWFCGNSGEGRGGGCCTLSVLLVWDWLRSDWRHQHYKMKFVRRRMSSDSGCSCLKTLNVKNELLHDAYRDLEGITLEIRFHLKKIPLFVYLCVVVVFSP